MIKKDYNTILYDKMKAELDRFIAELKTKTPEQIIELAYELTIKEDLLSIFENPVLLKRSHIHSFRYYLWLFPLPQQSHTVATEVVESAQPQIFIVGPFVRKV